MKSVKYIQDLESIPVSSISSPQNKWSEEIINRSDKLKGESYAIEAGVATEIGLISAFNKFNIDDSYFEAFSKAYPRLSETVSLYQKSQEATEAGVRSMTSLVSNVKAKVFEVELVESLNKAYPGWDFQLAERANQPVWDLKGVGPNGEEMLVQAKMYAEKSAGKVTGAMENNPDVFFATSTEVQNKIIENTPDLSEQLILTNTSNIELTEDVSSGLDQLMANYGLDVPDKIGEYLPFIGEIVLGVKLLIEIAKVNRDFSKIDLNEKRRIQGLRAIMAISRFGIVSVLAITGGALGGPFGALGGVGVAMIINNKIKPHINDIALKLMELDNDELVYLKNKESIDNLATRFSFTPNKFGFA